MKKIYSIILLIIIGIPSVLAQFNPEKAEKSLVKVMITGGGKMGVCSGFIWKKKSWVVTSLHAMKKNGIIEIEYPGNNIRDAKVIHVFESADLMLLETNIDAKPVANEIIPLTGYAQEKPEFGEKIYAIGYNGGSLGNQTQQLEKGHANPETLWFLVREQDQASLSAVGFPSMKIPIYFLSGSLLPGFSGSPIYNTRNELIGIGDGGLERGQMNVSWCIPAFNLDKLETSPPVLPAKLGEASMLYTAEVSIDVKSDDPKQNYEAATQQLEKKYKSYSYGDFNFYQTKTRTLKEMLETTVDSKNLVGFAQEFEEMKIYIDYDDFDFDIYEDAANGFVLAIPVGTTLTYDNDNKMFSVDLSEFEGGQYFGLFYSMDEHNGNPVDEFITGANEAFGKESQGLAQDPAYSRTLQLNQEWRADYFTLQGNAAYKFDPLGEVIPTLFTCIISNDKVAFQSFAIGFIPADRQDIAQVFQNGIDCVNNYDSNTESCDFFGWLFHMIAASQLTSLSSTQ
jgi:hypothetical protein